MTYIEIRSRIECPVIMQHSLSLLRGIATKYYSHRGDRTYPLFLCEDGKNLKQFMMFVYGRHRDTLEGWV